MAGILARIRKTGAGWFLLGLISLAAEGCGSGAHPPNQPITLTVSAAISLKAPLEAISQSYEKGHPDEHVVCNFGASGTLQHQIEQGAPVDIFISAGESQMDALEKDSVLVPGTRRDLLGNQLVLIVPARSEGIKDFPDLTKSTVRSIAVGDPQVVPAGTYAKETLENLGLLPKIQRKLVYAQDVRQALAYVETGNADAGLVYVTDARTSNAVHIAATAPGDSHLPILYPIALLKDSKSPEAAHTLLEMLESSDSLSTFEKYGFTAASSGAPQED
ncbi:MAG TPA: molybdate ABC transporter substrate-binding protein [Candidatus Acidoferrales bacterium]|nr:molybdate ABC transporter substrate-binding protein [Candidatus Acidoferrales bacterium]